MDKLLVFDIDMTLVNTDGAGFRAMTRAFAHLFGVENAFLGVDFAGRPDGAILRDSFTLHRLIDEGYASRSELFRVRYLELLNEELEARAGIVLPGVPTLLERLQARDDVRLGLGTGNFRGAAEIKLRRHGLWTHFRDGGFADDSEDRGEVIAAAIRRLRNGSDAAPAIYVIGDTRHDVAAAKANGACAIGVATGGTSSELLLAAGADHVFDDLTDGDRFLSLLER